MITTGIIREINISSSNHTNNKYLVELNIFQIPGDMNKDNYTCLANCSSTPGQYDAYKVGDRVYVGFLNNDLSLPIILGKIYQGNSPETCSAINSIALNVAEKAQLPNDTTIGDISYKQILQILNQKQKKYYMHNITAKLKSGNLCKFQLLTTIDSFKDTESNQILTALVATEFYRINYNLNLMVLIEKPNIVPIETYLAVLSYDTTTSQLLVSSNENEYIESIQEDRIVEI